MESLSASSRIHTPSLDIALVRSVPRINAPPLPQIRFIKMLVDRIALRLVNDLFCIVAPIPPIRTLQKSRLDPYLAANGTIDAGSNLPKPNILRRPWLPRRHPVGFQPKRCQQK